MRLAAVVIAAISVMAFLAACGGEADRDPPDQLLLEADFSNLPDDADRDAAMTAVVEVLERRTAAFGATDVKVEVQDSGRVTVTLGDFITEEDARQLMVASGRLDLRQPVQDENGRIVCETADGDTFSIATDEVVYPESGVRRLPVCRAGEEASGDIVWEDIHPGQDPAAIVRVQPTTATVDRTDAPMVVASFDPATAQILQEVTGRLVGLPLGIFVDGELLAGPTVTGPMTTSSLVIAGLSLPEANILAAQLSSGALVVPLRVTSAEDTR